MSDNTPQRKRRALPDPTDPLPTGEQPVAAGKSFMRIEVPASSTAQRLVTNTRRKLADLPALPEHMNSFAIVLIYTASGLSDREIAVATGFDASQLLRIREHPAYTQLEKFVIDAVHEQSGATVAATLAAAEVKAAESIVSQVDSEDADIAYRASKDVLDRRGHSPKQQVDMRTMMNNTFRIEVVDKRSNARPVIDAQLEE